MKINEPFLIYIKCRFTSLLLLSFIFFHVLSFINPINFIDILLRVRHRLNQTKVPIFMEFTFWLEMQAINKININQESMLHVRCSMLNKKVK